MRDNESYDVRQNPAKAAKTIPEHGNRIIRRDKKNGKECIAASIVLKEGSKIGTTEIQQLCLQRLSSHKIPRSFKFFRQRLVMET